MVVCQEGEGLERLRRGKGGVDSVSGSGVGGGGYPCQTLRPPLTTFPETTNRLLSVCGLPGSASRAGLHAIHKDLIRGINVFWFFI